MRAVLGPPIHLSPAADLAERVLLPGDPQRALRMAQALLESPRMFNTRRGLWGYTGTAADESLVTIQATGMGGPSAAIVVEELVDLGARVLIRTGTCGALASGAELGELVTAAEVLPADGASRALGAEGPLRADTELTGALVRAGGGSPVTAVSTDLFYDPRPDIEDEWRRAGAAVIEMEAAAVLATAARRGVRAACVLLVTDVLGEDGSRRRIEQDRLESCEERLGAVALRALAVSG
ncbi:MAG: purine-nucleoside phosphorylase [Thermoleophilaceae bacterium]|nr:purine-nucleoside phosphorylase [Thermoleophilaceae bacterium]